MNEDWVMDDEGFIGMAEQVPEETPIFAIAVVDHNLANH